VIGYVTNRIAVKMIFRPIRPVRVLGLRLQGLIGRRQQDLAASIGRVVGEHLVQHEDLARALAGVDLEPLLGDLLDEALAPKIAELRALPLVGGFLSEARVADIRKAFVRGILVHEDRIARKLEAAFEKAIDVRALVTAKVAAFPVEKLEKLVLEVAARELRAIEWLGGLLGLLIGVVQVLVLAAL
jgi:uncharacterized membrane protein YheB (UPF0754 family)